MVEFIFKLTNPKGSIRTKIFAHEWVGMKCDIWCILSIFCIPRKQIQWKHFDVYSFIKRIDQIPHLLHWVFVIIHGVWYGNKSTMNLVELKNMKLWNMKNTKRIFSNLNQTRRCLKFETMSNVVVWNQYVC